jgi:hypothetical protein
VYWNRRWTNERRERIEVTDPGEPTPEVTDEPTDEVTAEPTDTPETETDVSGGGDSESNGLGPTALLAVLAVLFLGMIAVGLLRGRNHSPPDESRNTQPVPTDSERVISLLHQNNGQMFTDVLEKELQWSPAHTRRVLDGLVATGDVELESTTGGTLVLFAESR